MTETIKIAGNTVPIGTSNTNIKGKLIRVVATAPLTITVFDIVTNSQYASIAMAGNTVINLQKRTTDLLTSSDGANCFGSPVGYSD
jgi:hypothetical protein